MAAGKEGVVLVIGACALDRLISVPSYPPADAKILATDYQEQGGGNAANTAHALGLFFSPLTRVKLVTKVGDDSVGRQLKKELADQGVDVSLAISSPETTSSIATVIVDVSSHTRTCFFARGTCGILELKDLDQTVDQLLQDVIHVHSDSRFAQVSLHIAREAKKRGIPVTVDVEKDRKTSDLDELVKIADVLLTNENQLSDYIQRLESAQEQQRDLLPLIEQSHTGDALPIPYEQALATITLFTRFYRQNGKEVVVTLGGRGAFRIQCTGIQVSRVEDTQNRLNDLHVVAESKEMFQLTHKFTEQESEKSMTVIVVSYLLEFSGILSEVRVVDTTGAGDALCGGYIFGKIINKHYDSEEQLSPLRLGCWTGGHKVQGPGARSSLPTADDLYAKLGGNLKQMKASLLQVLTRFK